MFGPFQKRLTTWFGCLKIDAGKGTQAALTVNQNAESSANLLDLQVNNFSTTSVDRYGSIRVPTNQYVGSPAFPNAIRIQSGALTLGGSSGLQLGNDGSMTLGGKFYSDGTNIIGQRSATNAQESRIYATWTSATNYQRLSTKTIKEALTATAGATKTSTITIPAYSQLIGVTTRVTTALGTTNGTTGYQVGDGTDADLWGAITGTAQGTTSDRRDFTAVDALGPDGADRTITLTAVGGNFDGTGVIEVCAYYLAAEAD